jgi:hypothetical protein
MRYWRIIAGTSDQAAVEADRGVIVRCTSGCKDMVAESGRQLSRLLYLCEQRRYAFTCLNEEPPGLGPVE